MVTGVESLDAAFNEAEAIVPTSEVEAIPEPVLEPVETPAEPVQVTPEEEAPRTVPLPVFLDQRDELKEAKRRLAELETTKPEPAEVPDPYDDPEGYNKFQGQQLQQALVAQRFEMSEMMATQTHGAEAVTAAAEWAEAKAKADPVFAASYMRERHPIDWIVRQHKQDGIRSKLDGVTDLDEWVKQRATELGLTATAAVAPAVVESQPAPTTPRRSLASEPAKHGAVKDVPVGPLAGLAAVFG